MNLNRVVERGALFCVFCGSVAACDEKRINGLGGSGKVLNSKFFIRKMVNDTSSTFLKPRITLG